MIAVLGPGGVGGVLAARTGALCVGTPRTAAAIRAGGLSLTAADGTTVTHPEAIERLDRPVSLLVVAVKVPALAEALARIEPAAVADAVVLPLQNGLEHLALVRALLPDAAVVAGTIHSIEAFTQEPGVVVQRTAGAVVAVASDSLSDAVLAAALAPLRVPGVEVVLEHGERALLWRKAARMAVLAAATAASGATVGELRSSPAWRPRLEGGLAEACAVAAAEGVQLDEAAEWATIEALPAELVTSAARDVAAGRPSELDAITGAVVRAAGRRHVPVPILEALLAAAAARR